jgi:GlpG protein
LWDLGGMVERNQGVWYLGGLVLVSGVAGNLAQYAYAGPAFGGMSGVVYALLGYVWMQGRYNPRAGLFLHKEIVAMMLIWFVLGWTGLIGHIANMDHTAGLLVGVAWGYTSASLVRR